MQFERGISREIVCDVCRFDIKICGLIKAKYEQRFAKRLYIFEKT